MTTRRRRVASLVKDRWFVGVVALVLAFATFQNVFQGVAVVSVFKESSSFPTAPTTETTVVFTNASKVSKDSNVIPHAPAFPAIKNQIRDLALDD